MREIEEKEAETVEGKWRKDGAARIDVEAKAEAVTRIGVGNMGMKGLIVTGIITK